MPTAALPQRPDIAQRRDVPPRPDAVDAEPRRGRRRLVVVLAIVLASTATTAIVLERNGHHGSHAFLATLAGGGPLRWDPCEPIHYQVNYANAPAGASGDVREAIARIAEASGIEFVDDGVTERTPAGALQAGFRGTYELPIPVLIAWEPRATFRTWAPPSRVAGFGLPWRGTEDRYVSGMIVIQADAPIPVGFDGRSSLGPVLMHEWGHVLGLGHVASGRELMWSPLVPDAAFPDVLQTTLGPGDLEGLAAVGRPAGCLPASVEGRVGATSQ